MIFIYLFVTSNILQYNGYPTKSGRANLPRTYRFADYKKQVIELLMRVCTVSVGNYENFWGNG